MPKFTFCAFSCFVVANASLHRKVVKQHGTVEFTPKTSFGIKDTACTVYVHS